MAWKGWRSSRISGFFSILFVIICIFSTVISFLIPDNSLLQKLERIQQDYPPGSKFTGSFRGAYECFGFAGCVFYALYGCCMPNSYCRETWYQFDSLENLRLIGQLTQKEISENSVRQLLSQGKPGDIIQYGTSSYPHTMLLLQTEADGFQVYDCNYDNQCTVMIRQVSYQALAAEIGSDSSRCGVTLYRAQTQPN